MSCMARPVFWTVFGSSRHENSPSVRVKRVIELGLNFKGCFVRANKSHEVHAYAQLYKREAPRHLSYPQVSSWPNRKRWRRWLLSRERAHASVDHRPATSASRESSSPSRERTCGVARRHPAWPPNFLPPRAQLSEAACVRGRPCCT